MMSYSLHASRLLSIALFVAFLPFVAASAQDEGIRTQTLIRVDSKAQAIPTIPTTSLMVNNKPAQLTSLTQVAATGTQIAILLDDGLRRSAALQFDDIGKFIVGLPAGTEVMVGYMANGGVRAVTPFTTNHEVAAQGLRMPTGIPGISASPYFCLSEFVKAWPGNDERMESGPRSGNKARFVLMVTNGVDPYNGSTSILNQDSPYVQTAVNDANRAGVAVSSIYYGDSGLRGGRASFSGQGYLQQVAEGTGGEAYYQGTGNPVSFQPFLKQFQAAISETYIATFDANPKGQGREQLVRLKINSSVPKLKLRHAEQVRPGNHESAPQG
jgi:hypothetical protein